MNNPIDLETNIEWVGPYEFMIQGSFEIMGEILIARSFIKKDFPDKVVYFWKRYPKEFDSFSQCLEFRKKYPHIFDL